MDHESSDILGRPSLPIAPTGGASRWLTISFSLKIASILLLIVFGYSAFIQAWDIFLKWKEKSYRLAMRRRYGIPDNDHRPFNVAHAAVLRARQEREAQERSNHLSAPAQAMAEAQSLRQRFPDTDGQPNAAPRWLDGTTTHAVPSKHSVVNFPASSSSHKRLLTDPVNFADRYNPNSPTIRILAPEAQAGASQIPNSSGRSSKRRLDLTAGANEDTKKRLSDDEDKLEPFKKTRVEGKEFIDGDEDAEWQASTKKPKDIEGRLKRGAKRVLGDEEDEVADAKRTRGKRARKVSKEHFTEKVDQIMLDEESDGDSDEISALRSITRGKKRDRAEAGSTFGGDDGDSAVESDAEEGIKIRQRRKRRTVAKRKSEIYFRGQKRDRDADWHDSEDEEGSEWPKGRKKREKIFSEDEGYQGSNTSTDDSQVSHDPLCKGRRIGDEWEANGVQYKVGPNGERLRQALVKKARSKFVMPKDSQHPDRQANLEVFVETWLTEDQYKDAKDQQRLAWQDSPKASVEPETPGNVPDSPSKAGKNLLWSTPRKDSPVNGKLFRQSIATSVGLRINPFQQSRSSSGRRIASAFAGDLVSGPKLVQRSFSKWEKQDLEAEAMAKLREKRKAEDPEKKLGEAGCGTASTSSSTTVTPTAPFSFPKAPPTESKPAPAISFGVSPATVDAPKLAEPTKTPTIAPTLSLGIPAPSGSQSVTTSPANAGQSQPLTMSFTIPPSTSVPTFSLTPPSTQETPAQAPSTSPSHLGVPKFSVSKASGASSASTLSTGTTLTTPTPPNPTTVLKPVSFGFTSETSAAPSQFSYGFQSAKPQTESQRKSEQGAGDTTSPFSVPSGSSGASSGGTVANSGPMFSFAKPSAPFLATPAGKSTSVFGGSTTPTKTPPPITTTAQTTSGTAGPSSVKFDFGFVNKASSNPPAPAASTQLPISSAASITPAAPSFNFSAPQPNQSTPAETTRSTTPKFNFGMSSGPTLGRTSGNQSAPSSQSNPEQPATAKSAFSGFGGSGAGTFSTAPPTSSSGLPTSGNNVFGGSAWGSTATATPQRFPFEPGNSSTVKPSESKSAFSFTTPSSTNAVTGEAPKLQFSTTQTAPATGEQNKPASQFSFMTTTANKPTSLQPSIFNTQFTNDSAQSSSGKPASPSAFGFGTPGSTTGFSFNAPPSNLTGQQQQQQ